MDEATSTSGAAEHHALLVGINAYPDQPLEGCVRDARAIKTYLESLPAAVHLRLLAASQGSSSRRPTEDPGLWPTYDNVKASLEDIASKAKPGSFVYIHYSGHGVRIRPSTAIFSLQTGDVALALLAGADGDKVRYLRGLELAYRIKALVDKGSLVTLVLDCCFSGGFSRADDTDGIRCLPYDAQIDATSPFDPLAGIAANAGPSVARDVSMLPNWVINPDGYTILAACGPHQVAREVKFEDGKRHGALTYLLLRTLIKSDPSDRRQQDTYDHLCSLFRSHCPRQDPALYGNTDLRFFGPPVAGVGEASVQLTRGATDGPIMLQAGRAHGLCDGDLFLAYPFHQQEGEARNITDQPPLLRTAKVGELVSELEEVRKGPGQPKIQTGWKVRWHTRTALRQYPTLVSVNHELLDKWRVESGRRTSLDIRYGDTGGIAFSFHVALTDLGQYEILDEYRNVIAQVPAVSKASSGAGLSNILETIEHLTWFKHVRAITNQSPSVSFQNSLSIRLTAPPNKTFDPTGVVEVRDGDRLVLEVRNLGSSALFFYIYNMDSSWQIQNILSAAYLTIPARDSDKNHLGMIRKVLKMAIPPEIKSKGQLHCDDVVKVFVTARPVSFAPLEIPKLGASAKADSEQGIPVAVPDQSDTEKSEWVAINFHLRTIAK
jgi:hypothetical protein